MKTWLLITLLLPVSGFMGHPPVEKSDAGGISPLSNYSAAWNNPKYLACNTAANANYMTKEEKETIYILNMMRMDPALFAATVAATYPDSSHSSNMRNSTYYKSLMLKLRKQKSLKPLVPDELCFIGAQCHAVSSGKSGYVGHERATEECEEKWYFNGECCDYGHQKALDIVMALMIDEDVPSLGHRAICLTAYKTIGVSIQPHTLYGHTAVIDFHF